MKVRRSALGFPQRWLRFQMRGLLAFIAICACGARLGSEVNGYYTEQRALTGLRGLGGAFMTDSPISIFL